MSRESLKILLATLTAVLATVSIFCGYLALKPEGVDARLAFVAIMGLLIVIAVK